MLNSILCHYYMPYIILILISFDLKMPDILCWSDVLAEFIHIEKYSFYNLYINLYQRELTKLIGLWIEIWWSFFFSFFRLRIRPYSGVLAGPGSVKGRKSVLRISIRILKRSDPDPVWTLRFEIPSKLELFLSYLFLLCWLLCWIRVNSSRVRNSV